VRRSDLSEPGLGAVLFDIDDTLYSTTRFAERARERAIEAMIRAGLRTPPERIKDLLHEVIDEYRSNFPHQFDEVLSRLPANTYEPVNPAVIVASAVAAYHDTKFRELRAYDEVPVVLAALRQRGARMGVVTTGVPVKQAEKLVRLRLLDLFEPAWVFITDQMELPKQSSRLWERVCLVTGVEPARTLYVGDHATMDVDPANEAGLVTVLVRRGGKYSGIEGRTKPTHEIGDFCQLDVLLRDTYHV